MIKQIIDLPDGWTCIGCGDEYLQDTEGELVADYTEGTLCKKCNSEDNMKKWKVSNLVRGYQIEENYVLANDEDEAYEKMENEEYIGEWKIVKDEMSTEDTEITEVKQQTSEKG